MQRERERDFDPRFRYCLSHNGDERKRYRHQLTESLYLQIVAQSRLPPAFGNVLLCMVMQIIRLSMDTVMLQWQRSFTGLDGGQSGDSPAFPSERASTSATDSSPSIAQESDLPWWS